MSDASGACDAIARTLSQLKNYASGNPRNSGWDALGQVLRVKSSNRLHIIRKRNKLLAIFPDAAQEIEQLGISSSLFKEWLDPAESGLSMMPLDVPVGQSTTWLKPDLLKKAEATSELVKRDLKLQPIDSATTLELIGKLRALEEQVLTWTDNVATPDTRKWLLKELRTIREALEDVQLTGAGPLKRAMSVTWGRAVVDWPIWKWLNDTEPGKFVKQVLFQVIAVVGTQVSQQLLAQPFPPFVIPGPTIDQGDVIDVEVLGSNDSQVDKGPPTLGSSDASEQRPIE